jgi:hypothetical protein
MDAGGVIQQVGLGPPKLISEESWVELSKARLQVHEDNRASKQIAYRV